MKDVVNVEQLEVAPDVGESILGAKESEAKQKIRESAATEENWRLSYLEILPLGNQI